jgi:hypothetical protein
VNPYTIEFLARDRIDQFAREARAGDLLPREPGTEPSWLASIVGLVRRLTRRPGLDSPSGSAATRPHIA